MTVGNAKRMNVKWSFRKEERSFRKARWIYTILADQDEMHGCGEISYRDYDRANHDCQT